ncbi:MAG: hypothetical protein IJ498_01840 [Akkermansia sp.]|nr:hypothetical protein [Akkermansia sp.]
MDSRKKDEKGEAQLLMLLASLKVEATPEANFEERFLYDFHERVARETVCCPAHQRVWEHLMQILHNFGKRKLVFGASTLGVGALTMGYMIVPSSTDDSTNPRVLVAKRFDDAVSSLVPGLTKDCGACTSIRIDGFDADASDELLGSVGQNGVFGYQESTNESVDADYFLYSERSPLMNFPYSY